MAIVVVVVIAYQVLHGALQQAVLQVLFHGDLTHTHTHNTEYIHSVIKRKHLYTGAIVLYLIIGFIYCFSLASIFL